MATTENNHTGNGSETDYSFTFPYLNTTDIKVSVDSVLKTITTDYTLHNATTIRFNSPPADTKPIRIYRDTNDDSLTATFYPGSAIRANDLNNNSLQNLYVTQESAAEVATATTTANTAKSTADTAKSTAATALSNSRESDGEGGYNTAISVANTAKTTAESATTTANSAVTTANAAQAAVDAAVLYTPIANVAAIPGSPEDQDYIEVGDTTGIESFTPLAGLPSGFTGDSGLTVKLKYTTSGSTWNYQSYHADDPEDRYVPVYGKHNTTQVVYTVKVVTKTAAHRYHGSGSSDGFTLGGIEAPFLTLIPGNTYRFDQADSSNSGHTIAFYEKADKTNPWTTDVTTNGTAGSAGAYTQIVVGDTTPANLHYQCTSHAYEGNGIITQTNTVGVAATGGGSDEVLYENGQTITTNYTITTNKSAYATGPVTINNSIVVTVPENSRWVIA